MNVYELSASIVLHTGDFEESLAKAGKQANAFGDVLKANLVSEAVISGVKKLASAVVDVGKSSLSAYADYEQLAGGAQLMFGDAYDYVNERSKQAYKNVQMSQNDYLRQVNGFATGLKTAMGGNARAAAELADKIVTAEADVVAATGNSQEAVQNAFNGIMKNNYTMLDNLQLGIVPTKEGFQSLIDKVNDWNEQNGKMTSYTVDNLADCQQALVDYISMQGLSGYAAMEASGTIEGSFASVRAAWSNLLTGIGDDDAEIDRLTGDFVDSVKNAAKNAVPVFFQIVDNLWEATEQGIEHLRETNPVINDLFTALDGIAVIAAGFTLKRVADAFVAAGGAAKIWEATQAKLNALLKAAPYVAMVGGIVLVTKALKNVDDWYKRSLISQLGDIGQSDGTIAGISSEIAKIDEEMAKREHRNITSTDSLSDYLTNSNNNYIQYQELKKRREELVSQLEELTDAETAAGVASGEISARSVESAYAIQDAATSFSESAQQILSSYWDTYNSIYTGLFNAANVFTQVQEKTQFAEDGTTGAQKLRQNLEGNTRFYEQYAADLEYVQGAAADAGVDLSALMEILGSMSTEDAAGAISSVREELENVGNAGAVAQKNVIENWGNQLERYSEAVSAATKPLAEAATGVHDQLNALLEEYTQSVEGLDQSEEAKAAAKATLEALAFGIDQNTSGVLSSLDVLTGKMKNQLAADFSDFVLTIQAVVGLDEMNAHPHRSGLGYVPYDGYLAALHAGERVLTASEASEYRRGGGSQGGVQSLNITIPLELDGEMIGRASYQYAFNESRRMGT